MDHTGKEAEAVGVRQQDLVLWLQEVYLVHVLGKVPLQLLSFFSAMCSELSVHGGPARSVRVLQPRTLGTPLRRRTV